MIEDNGEHTSQFIKDCDTDWNLNHEFLYWLNYWMKEYKKKAKIDLDFHIFKYEGKEMTQREIIDRIIELTDALTNDYYTVNENYEALDEVFDLFHLVFWCMWW